MITVMITTRSLEQNEKNSKRVEQFVECFGAELVVTNHSTVEAVAVNGCF